VNHVTIIFTPVLVEDESIVEVPRHDVEDF
jgi:hypothetical protein